MWEFVLPDPRCWIYLLCLPVTLALYMKRVEMTAAVGSGSTARPSLPQPSARLLPLVLGSGPSPFEASRQPSSGRPGTEDLRSNPLTGTRSTRRTSLRWRRGGLSR